MKLLDPHKLGKNHDFTKRVNRATVLNLLRTGDNLSRAELARKTRLSIQSVSNIVSALQDAGLIDAQKRLYGGKGQPPVPYRIRPDAGVSVGIDLDEGQVRAVLTDFSYIKIAHLERAHSATDLPTILDLLTSVIDDLFSQAGITRDRFWGVGLATPQLMTKNFADIRQLEAGLWSRLGKKRFAAHLSESIKRPVFVENDANAGALGELIFGAGKRVRHFCYLHAAAGLGLGVIHDAQLFRGAGGNAGEIGRFRIGPHADAPIVEEVFSLAGLQKAQQSATGEQEWVANVACILRWLVGLIENTFDPQTIIFGGHFSLAVVEQLIESANPLPATIADRLERDMLRLQPSPLGSGSVSLGASVMPFIGTSEPDPTANWRYEGQLFDIYPG